VQNDKYRSNFLRNLLWFLGEHKLDGVDYNWEYPQSQADWIGLFKLLAEVPFILIMPDDFR
jgi:GH18 family chitinase